MSIYRELSNEELEATIEECQEFIKTNPHLLGGCHAMREIIEECETIIKARETGEPLPEEPGIDYYIEQAEKRVRQAQKEIDYDDKLRAAGKKPYLSDGFIRNRWEKSLETYKQDLIWLKEQKEEEEMDNMKAEDDNINRELETKNKGI